MKTKRPKAPTEKKERQPWEDYSRKDWYGLFHFQFDFSDELMQELSAMKKQLEYKKQEIAHLEKYTRKIHRKLLCECDRGDVSYPFVLEMIANQEKIIKELSRHRILEYKKDKSPAQQLIYEMQRGMFRN